jgi:hypothetical protein
MTKEGRRSGRETEEALFDLVFLFAQRVTFDRILVFRLGLGFFLVVLIRDHIETNRMYLDDLDLGLALGAVEDLAFFYFIFVNVNLDGTFRAAHHSRTSGSKIALAASRRII